MFLFFRWYKEKKETNIFRLLSGVLFFIFILQRGLPLRFPCACLPVNTSVLLEHELTLRGLDDHVLTRIHFEDCFKVKMKSNIKMISSMIFDIIFTWKYYSKWTQSNTWSSSPLFFTSFSLENNLQNGYRLTHGRPFLKELIFNKRRSTREVGILDFNAVPRAPKARRPLSCGLRTRSKDISKGFLPH